MECLLQLNKEGKIKHVRLTECSFEELKRAQKIFPNSAIQMEWSLHKRRIEKFIVHIAKKLEFQLLLKSFLGDDSYKELSLKEKKF